MYESYRSGDGGQTTAIAAATGTDTVVKDSPGKLCRVLITTAGTAAVEIYDHASSATGTKIGHIAASAAAGTVATFMMPAANGITVKGSANLPAMTISYL